MMKYRGFIFDQDDLPRLPRSPRGNQNGFRTMTDFKCQGCGACCRIKDGIVRIGDDEVRRIAAFLGMTEQEFIDRETEIAPDRKTLILKSRPDESCVYLTDDNRCCIHPVKPDKCRTFPFEWTNADSADVCPALNFSAEKQR